MEMHSVSRAETSEKEEIRHHKTLKPNSSQRFYIVKGIEREKKHRVAI